MRSLFLALAIFFVSSTHLLNRMRRSHALWGRAVLLQTLGRKARQESGRFKASMTYLCRGTL